MYRTPWRFLVVLSALLALWGVGITVWGISASAPGETIVLSLLTVVLGALLVRISLFGIRHGRPPTVTGWVALGVVTISVIWGFATRT
jgi:hypothetical protein